MQKFRVDVSTRLFTENFHKNCMVLSALLPEQKEKKEERKRREEWEARIELEKNSGDLEKDLGD